RVVETDRSLKSRVLAPEVELEPREGVDAEPLRVERSVELKRAAEHRAILAMGELENEEAPKVLLDLDGLEVAQEAASAVGEGDLVEPRRRKLERAEQRMLDPRALRRQRRQRPVDRRSVDQANAREGASTRVARPRSSLGIAVALVAIASVVVTVIELGGTETAALVPGIEKGGGSGPGKAHTGWLERLDETVERIAGDEVEPIGLRGR